MPKTFLKISRTRSPSSIWAKGSLRKRCLGVGGREAGRSDHGEMQRTDECRILPSSASFLLLPCPSPQAKGDNASLPLPLSPILLLPCPSPQAQGDDAVDILGGHVSTALERSDSLRDGKNTRRSSRQCFEPSTAHSSNDTHTSTQAAASSPIARAPEEQPPARASPSSRSYLCRPVGDDVPADPVDVELTADLRDLDAEVVGHVRLLQQRPRLHDAVGQRLLLGVVLGPEVRGRWKARGDTSGGE